MLKEIVLEKTGLRRPEEGGGGGGDPTHALFLRVQDAAEAVGKKIAEICLEKGIDKVCYDRGGHIYHGRIKVGPACQASRLLEHA